MNTIVMQILALFLFFSHLGESKKIDIRLIYQSSADVFPVSIPGDSAATTFLVPISPIFPLDTESPVQYFKGEVGQVLGLAFDTIVYAPFHFAVKILIGHKVIENMNQWKCCTPMMLLNPSFDRLGMNSLGMMRSIQKSYVCNHPIEIGIYCGKYDTDSIDRDDRPYTVDPGRPFVYMFYGRNETFDLPIVYPIPTDAVLKLATLPSNLKIYIENGEIAAGVDTQLYYFGGYGTSLGKNGEVISYSVSLNGVAECTAYEFEVFVCYKSCKSCNRKYRFPPSEERHYCNECHKLYAPDPAMPGNCILSTEGKELIELFLLFQETGIQLSNPDDPFFSTRCVALPFPSEVDIPKKDRIKKFLQSNNTFCSDSCHFLGINSTTHDPLCECTKPPLKNNETTFNGIKDNFLATLFDANYDVIFCYMLVFDSIIFPKNIGSWLMLGIGLTILGNILYSMLRSMKSLTQTVEDMCKTPIENNTPSNIEIALNEQQPPKPRKQVNIPAESSVRQQMTSKMSNMNNAKPSPPPKNDQQVKSYDKKEVNNNSQSGSFLQQQAQAWINQPPSLFKYNSSQSVIPEEDNIIKSMNYYQAKKSVVDHQFDQLFSPEYGKLIQRNVTKVSVLNLNEQLERNNNDNKPLDSLIDRKMTMKGKGGGLVIHNQNQPYKKYSHANHQFLLSSSLYPESPYYQREYASQGQGLPLSKEPIGNEGQRKRLSMCKELRGKNEVYKQECNNVTNEKKQQHKEDCYGVIPIVCSNMYSPERRSKASTNQSLIVTRNKTSVKKDSNVTQDVTIVSQIPLKPKKEVMQIKQKQSLDVIPAKIDSSQKTQDNSPVDYDEMDFETFTTRDKRHFCLLYWWYLQSVHSVIDTFITPSPTMPRAIKISLFILGIILDLFLTAFFYSDKYISNNYNNDDSSNFIYDLPVSIYTYLVSSVIGVLLGVLSNTERGIKKIEKCQSGQEKITQTKKFLKCYSIRLMIFNVLQIALILFFWYYIAAFCAVYPNSQDEYLSSYGISLGLSMLMPFPICLGLVGIHMIIIKCKCKCLYKVLSVLTWFL